MLLESLIKIFDRDLEKLKSEIKLFEKEENLWLLNGDIKNSAGNLALHLCGNLKHYVGHSIGGSSYIRERDKEFSLKNVPKLDILRNIEETKSVVLSTLKMLDDSKLKEIFSEKISIGKVEIGFLLIHLIAHLNYHLGQINYIRRLFVYR